MTNEYRAKTFKSGNSVALRLPKGLGIEEGREMKVREKQGRYIVEPVEPPQRKIDLTGIWGVLKGGTIDLGDRKMEPRKLDWGGRRQKRG